MAILKGCPFCGHEPIGRKDWWPTSYFISCNNSKCLAQPGVGVAVECKEQFGVTYEPMWEPAILKAEESWNTRF
jgi:hypothetical protein